ncbi:MAG: hypothetical protein ACR2N4_06625 [Jatrophihabitans sp.]
MDTEWTSLLLLRRPCFQTPQPLLDHHLLGAALQPRRIIHLDRRGGLTGPADGVHQPRRQHP